MILYIYDNKVIDHMGKKLWLMTFFGFGESYERKLPKYITYITNYVNN